MVSVVERSSHSRCLFDGIPDSFEVARYHSLYGDTENFPGVLRATAVTEDGVVGLCLYSPLPMAGRSGEYSCRLDVGFCLWKKMACLVGIDFWKCWIHDSSCVGDVSPLKQ